jgi:hypothetical protein
MDELNQDGAMDSSQPVDSVAELVVTAQPEAPAVEPTALEIVEDTLSESPKFVRDEAGKFVAKKPAEPEAPKVEDQAKPLVKPKDDDPLKMPDGLTAPAQERFQGMATKIKELDGEVSSYKETIQTLTRTLHEHGVDDNVFKDLLTYSKVVTSGDTKQWGEMLRNQVRSYELASGQPFNSIDPMAAHPDIQQALQAGQINEAFARQLADSRDAQQRIGQAQQQHQQVRQTEQQSNEAIERGVSQVIALTDNWKQTDVFWGNKAEKVAAFAQEIAVDPNVPPSSYATLIKHFYTTLGNQSPTPQQRPASNVQPLRAAAGSAGPAVPTSFEDAVRLSIYGG